MKWMSGLRRFAMGLATVTAVAACGDSSGPKGNDTIDPAQAAVVGQEAAGQIADIASDLTTLNASSGGLGSGLFAPGAPGNRVARMIARRLPSQYQAQFAAFAAPDAACVPVVSGDTVDSDLDGIINNVTLTFGPGDCAYQDSLGNGFAVTGAFSLQDTDGGATLWGFAVDYSHFRVLFYTDSASAGYEFDGGYDATVTANNATANQNFIARWRLNGNPVLRADYAWGVTFLPDTGSLDPGQGELQSGTFDITGDYSWSGNFGQADGDWSFTVSTPTPLHYNQACDTDPELDGGQVRAAINGRNNIGFTVDYGPGCGQETVNTFDANAS